MSPRGPGNAACVGKHSRDSDPCEPFRGQVLGRFCSGAASYKTAEPQCPRSIFLGTEEMRKCEQMMTSHLLGTLEDPVPAIVTCFSGETNCELTMKLITERPSAHPKHSIAVAPGRLLLRLALKNEDRSLLRLPEVFNPPPPGVTIHHKFSRPAPPPGVR